MKANSLVKLVLMADKEFSMALFPKITARLMQVLGDFSRFNLT
jgi:hypothetical protein